MGGEVGLRVRSGFELDTRHEYAYRRNSTGFATTAEEDDMRARSALRSLTLTLTERCNMRCSYCHVPSDGGRTMRPEVADAAVDWLMQNGNDVTLSFYGGEPFVASGLMMRAIERARAAAGADGKRRLRVLTPTNGLMLSGSSSSFMCSMSAQRRSSECPRCPTSGKRGKAGYAMISPVWMKWSATVAN